MENTAQVSHAFLVKLVIRLMIHGAAGFLHKTETVRNTAGLPVMFQEHALPLGQSGTVFKGPPNSLRHGPLLSWHRIALQLRVETSPELVPGQGRAGRLRCRQAGRKWPLTLPRARLLIPNCSDCAPSALLPSQGAGVGVTGGGKRGTA